MNRNLICCIALLAAGCGGGGKPEVTEDFSDLATIDQKSDAFSNRMLIVGSLDYGQTSKPVAYKNPPMFRAFKFGGQKGDQVEVSVSSKTGDSMVWLLDNSFKVIAQNDDFGGSLDSFVKATLPGNTNPDIVTYYIVFRDYYRKAHSFTVSLKGPASDFFACNIDADCEKVKKGCCDIAGWIAVNKDQADEYRASLGCPANPICPLVAIPRDDKVALCNNGSRKCELVEPKDIECGGFSINPHQCPPSHTCMGDGLAFDAPGKCEENCGGFAGFTCRDQSNICVDNPYDSCDPQSGGADCMGVCRDEICSGKTARCAAGYLWSQFKCTCVENPCNVVDCAPGYTCQPKNDNTAAECVKEQTTSDCRTTGCGAGEYCTYCWINFACIPVGAVC